MTASDVVTGTLEAKGQGGEALFYRWQPAAAPRANVIIIHGLAEHGGRYTHVMDHLHAANYSVLALDLRGHGRSSGRRAFVRRWSDYTDDVDRAVHHVEAMAPGLPTFLIGHSMGGLVVIRYLQTYLGRVAGAVLSSPAVESQIAVPAWKDALGKVMSRLIPTLAIPTGIPPEHVSRDPAVVQAYQADPLVTSKATARWYTEFIGAQQAAMKGASTLRTPTLVLSPGADALISPAGVRRFHAQLGGDAKQLKTYPDLFHEGFNEPEKAALLEATATWLDAHTG